MFGIELDRTKKIQLGIIIALFGLAGYFVISNWDEILGTPADDTVTAFREFRGVLLDPSKPASAENPLDLKKSPVVTVFGMYDGRLEIAEYAPETGIKLRINFFPDRTRKSYLFWRDGYKDPKDISNPCKRALVAIAQQFAASRTTDRGGLGIAELDPDQRKKELNFRQAMYTDLSFIDDGAFDGTFQPKIYTKLEMAFEAFKANEADIVQDATKKKLALELIGHAMEYVRKSAEAKQVAIDKYVNQVEDLLQPFQRQRLDDAGKQLANNRNRRNRAG